jgi:hypothetical protein
VFGNSGVARGSGWQHLGAYVNLGAFYLCGIPVAAVLGFLTKLRGKGLWIGIQIGSFVQTVMLSIITSCINWEVQVYPSLLSHDAFVLCLVEDSQSLCLDAKTLEVGKQRRKFGIFDNHYDPKCLLDPILVNKNHLSHF